MIRKVLVIGYGNPGRLDDGLGPALAEAIQRRGIPGVTVDSDYQLTVEDAAVAAGHDVVVFADASVSGIEPFSFERVLPGAEMSFSTHHVEPQAVMTMVRELFHAATRGFALGIRGYEFNEFGERLSGSARRNMEAAAVFLEKIVVSDSFDAVAGRAHGRSGPEEANREGKSS
ncbi:MAG: hydrogenase maturation protease [bacterium]